MVDAPKAKTEVKTLKEALLKQGFGKATDDQFETGEAWKSFAKKAGVKEADINRVAIDIQAPCDSVIEDKSMEIVTKALEKTAPTPIVKQSVADQPDATTQLQATLVGKKFDLGKSGEKHDGVDGKYGFKTDCAAKSALNAIEAHANGLKDGDPAKASTLAGVKQAREDLKDKKPTEETASFINKELVQLSEEEIAQARATCTVDQDRGSEHHTAKPKRTTRTHNDRGEDGHRGNRHGGGGHRGRNEHRASGGNEQGGACRIEPWQRTTTAEEERLAMKLLQNKGVTADKIITGAEMRAAGATKLLSEWQQYRVGTAVGTYSGQDVGTIGRGQDVTNNNIRVDRVSCDHFKLTPIPLNVSGGGGGGSSGSGGGPGGGPGGGGSK